MSKECGQSVAPMRLPASFVPPKQRDQLAALIRWCVIFLDRARDRRLLIRSVVDDADELRGRGFDVVD